MTRLMRLTTLVAFVVFLLVNPAQAKAPPKGTTLGALALFKPRAAPIAAHLAPNTETEPRRNHHLINPQLPVPSRANAARLTLGLVASVYGTNYASVKLLGDWLHSPAEAAVLRFAVAFAAMCPVMATVARSEPRLFSWPVARDGISVGGLFALGYATQATALQTSNAGLQAFLLSLTVIVCPALEALLDQKRQPASVWWSAGLAMLGVGLLQGDAMASGTAAPGDLLGMLQAVFFGAGFYVCERAMTRHAADTSEFGLPVAITFYEMITILACALVWLGASDGPEALPTLLQTVGSLSLTETPELIAAVLWTGLVTTAGACVAEAAVLGRISSSDATVIFSSEPLWAVLFSNLLLGEVLNPICTAGGLLIVLSCVVSGTAPQADATGAQLEGDEDAGLYQWLVTRDRDS